MLESGYFVVVVAVVVVVVCSTSIIGSNEEVPRRMRVNVSVRVGYIGRRKPVVLSSLVCVDVRRN